MSHISLVDEQYHYFYDPTIYKYSTEFFYTISGTPTTYNGKMRFSNAKANTLGMYMFGTFEFKINLPSAPAAGQSKAWGIYSRAYGTRNAAFFLMSGTSLQVKTYSDNSDTPETTTIAIDSTDFGDETVYGIPYTFEIRWFKERVEFWIGNDSLKRNIATHYTKVPRAIPLPLYISNENSGDTMEITYIAMRGVRKYVPSQLVIATPSDAPSTSSSPSSSNSPSDSPSSSESPSLSPSSSNSPSDSPSSSESPSLSPSSSESPSESPSSSDSPSESPSESPSSSESPSESPSSSNSPSDSPSSSESPSLSPSSSASPSEGG